jgi:hypothetical protein
MKPLAPSLAVLAVLALAPAAGAKEFKEAKVCGTDGCADVSRQVAFAAVDGGPTSRPPSGQLRFYELRVTVAEGPGPNAEEASFAVVVVPAARRARTEDGRWMLLRGRTSAALRRAADGLAPFPASELDLSSRVVEPEPRGQPGPMNLRTPGQEAAGDGGGPGLLALGGAGLAIVLAATAAAWRLTRRRRAAAQG